MINRQKYFIFVHVPKTAGTSIRSLLETTFSQPARSVVKPSSARKFGRRLRRKLGLKTYNCDPAYIQLHNHARAAEYRSLLGNQFDHYFKFAFVRNPFSWQVSLYEYIKNTPSHRLNIFCNMIDFEGYLLSGVPESVRTQSSYLCDEETSCLVDFVGKFENLDLDWSHVSNRLDLPCSRLPRLNVLSSRKKYSSYLTPKTISLITNRFACDFERFGYSYDPLS